MAAVPTRNDRRVILHLVALPNPIALFLTDFAAHATILGLRLFLCLGL
jgi:hypothetical protein